MGNGFAYAMLGFWPLLTIYLYRTRPIQVATMWTIVGGFMFLPVHTSVDLPFIPALGKNSIPVLFAVICCWLVAKRPVRYFRNRGRLKLLVMVLFILPFVTVIMNRDAVITEGQYLPGLTMHDALSFSINQVLFIMPFFIGRQFFRSHDDHLVMFKMLVVACLFYSIFELFEIRMSPQLHTWIYGYFPHSSFGQQMRSGGFRPVVFMGHGLLVSFFTLVALISALALWKNKIKIRQWSPKTVTGYLLFVLILCKSMGAVIYGIFSLVIIKGVKIKTQHRIAVLLTCLALLYPAMSIMEVFPHQRLTHMAESISPARAESLQFRFDNEKLLLNRARERIFFGWGGWGRNRVYDERSGKDLSVTDGRWIIRVGTFGLVGFFAEFLLLSISVFRANKAAKLIKDKPQQTLLAAHALLVSIIMIDQIPNASLAPWLWLIAGALLGRSEVIIANSKVKKEKEEPLI